MRDIFAVMLLLIIAHISSVKAVQNNYRWQEIQRRKDMEVYIYLTLYPVM